MERTVDTPLGPLALQARDGALTRLGWGRAAREDESNLLTQAAAELAAYFAGELRDFDLPVAPDGTAHDRRVWRAMRDIAPGETRTYGEIARAIGSGAQAVGNACGRNPIPIVIPCHRIVAANGAIGGYSGQGGAETKRFLLRLEGAGVR
ncbi:MAG: methylated-DNA--[protein]-cysteine S-methyltransferase [Defluviicoccus sp.]|nr:methylated-DNA--[protein]-cysteine S-methyltransferase [Defluviicoccus sp.]MDE0277170.1 methylated-DNA--[protein]-cysteine S-methyltransferase [Defluviicoccus sp.]